MAKLTDTQLMILTAAAGRDGGAVLPLPKSLKANKVAVTRAIKSLVNSRLVDEQPATKVHEVWRQTKAGGRLNLVITAAGLSAIGADADDRPETQPAPATAQPRKCKSQSCRSALGHQTKIEAAPAAIPQGTKQALLIDLLNRKNGATIAEITKAIGWQAHSVRGAISGIIKKKLGLNVTSELVGSRGRVYRIVARTCGAH